MKFIQVYIARLLEKVRHLIRTTPFDQSTEEGRSQERHRKVLLSAVASAAAKIISVSTALITVPLTLNYLGVERYGLWMAISSVIAMLSFADFGIGNGVLSEVAKAHGRNDVKKIKEIISSGLVTLIGVCVFVILVFVSAYKFIDWTRIFNVKTNEAAQEVGPAIAVFVGAFAVGVPVNIINRIQAGLQQSFRVGVWQCISSLAGLFLILTLVGQNKGLPWLVAALVCAPIIGTILNGVHFFVKTRPDLLPELKLVSRDVVVSISKTGVLFFFLQISASISYSSDSFLIARLVGLHSVAEYSVAEKLFGLITVALTMLLSPLWPAYGEAISRGDHDWALRTLKNSIKMAMSAAAIFSILMLVFAQDILQIWVGSKVEVPFGLLLGFAVWKVFEVGGGALSVYLNGARIVGVQIGLSLLTTAIAVGMKIYGVEKFGVSSIPWAMCTAYVTFTFVPILVLILNKKINNKILGL